MTCEFAAILVAPKARFFMDFYQQLRDYDAIDSSESSTKEAVLRFIEAHWEASFGSEVVGEVGHVTSAAWILNHEATKVLLVFGSKVGHWKLPGEHVEGETELWEAAQEQAARALGSGDLEGEERIFAIVEAEVAEYWNTPAHRHFEVVWRFMAEEREKLPRGAKWFSLAEAATLGQGMFASLVEKSR